MGGLVNHLLLWLHFIEPFCGHFWFVCALRDFIDSPVKWANALVFENSAHTEHRYHWLIHWPTTLNRGDKSKHIAFGMEWIIIMRYHAEWWKILKYHCLLDVIELIRFCFLFRLGMLVSSHSPHCPSKVFFALFSFRWDWAPRGAYRLITTEVENLL